MRNEETAALFEKEDSKNFFLGPRETVGCKIEPGSESSRDDCFLHKIMLMHSFRADAAVFCIKQEAEASSWVEFFFNQLHKTGEDLDLSNKCSTFSKKKQVLFQRQYMRDQLSRRLGEWCVDVETNYTVRDKHPSRAI